MNDKSRQRALNALIEKANTISEELDPGAVASALLEAAARYASFYVASSCASRKDLKEDKDVLIQDISREFKKIFAENLEEYIEHYKTYLPDHGDDAREKI